jgi:hypothetical protein
MSDLRTAQDVHDRHKLCACCGLVLELDAFRPNPKLRSGLSSWCRECQVERTRRWRAEHPEAVEASNAQRRLGPYPPRPCDGCSETFTPRRKDGRFCSRPCLEEHRKQGGGGAPGEG